MRAGTVAVDRIAGLNERFEQIRTATLRAFYANGYHGASLREIALEVGIKVPSLYNYFSSKQELLFRLMSAVMEDLIAQTQQVALRTPGGPDEKLLAATRAFVLFNINHPHEIAVSDAEFRRLTARNRNRMIRLRDRFDAIFAGLLQDGIREGVFRAADVSVVKNTIVSSCARVYIWYRPSGRLDPDQIAEIVSNYLVKGLLARNNHRENRDQE